MLRWPRNGCQSGERKHQVEHWAELDDRRGLNIIYEIYLQ